jgi:uncharacterized damage-inducible protein DinB
MAEDGILALVEAWQINDAINRELLAALSDEQLGAPLAKGKAVAAQFSHIHNVRLMWLKEAAPDLLEGLEKLDAKESDRDRLNAALRSSGAAVAALMERAGSPAGRIKGFKPHAAAFVGYLIAHESFHRAQAELALRQAGLPMTDKTAYGLWEWGRFGGGFGR